MESQEESSLCGRRQHTIGCPCSQRDTRVSSKLIAGDGHLRAKCHCESGLKCLFSLPLSLHSYVFYSLIFKKWHSLQGCSSCMLVQPAMTQSVLTSTTSLSNSHTGRTHLIKYAELIIETIVFFLIIIETVIGKKTLPLSWIQIEIKAF